MARGGKGLFKGGALRLFQTFLYALTFLCAAIILGFYSYFLSVLADRNAFISKSDKAVEGISGAAVLYLIFAVLLTCFLGGISALAFLAIVLDILFAAAMIAVAVLTRHGASNCKGIVNTPLGKGIATSHGPGFNYGGDDKITYAVSLRTACRFNTACFAVSIIAAFLFLITAAMQVALVRHHKKEKRYGPSPSNNYTSGSAAGRKFWQRKPKDSAGLKDRDGEMAGGGLAVPAQDMRASHETGYTGTTMNGAANTHNKVDSQPLHPNGAHTGYYTQPQGTGVNPYGYEQGHTTTTTTTATNY